jgi:5-formyltetrahydrofolate cyclo-ligase
MELKNKIRLLYKSKRLGLDQEQRALLSDKINANVIQYLSGKAGIQHIHVFLPIDKLNEVDTFPLIKALQDQGKTIYTSTSDFKKGIMQTVKLVEDPLFGSDNYGIPVPLETIEGSSSLLQVVLVPLLAYDLDGHRLGYGKGFYDKFLSQLDGGVLKVGLSFFPAEKSIPTEEHDVRLDSCINPDGVIEF